MKTLLPTLVALFVACTPAARAPIERGLSASLSDGQLVCLLAEHAPGIPDDDHTKIAQGCGIGEVALQDALALLQAADRVRLGAPDAGPGG